MAMTRNRAMLEVRTITEGPLKRSELILDEVDYAGYYDLKSGSLIYRVGNDAYEIVQYVKG
jgi:hypothetical protein